MSDIVVPSPGESITQVQISRWLAANGETVQKDQEVVEIDSDKATFPVTSPVSGILYILIPEGETVNVGTVIARVEVSSSQKPAPAANVDLSVAPKPLPADREGVGAKATPLARKMIREQNIDPGYIESAFPGKKITRKEIGIFLQSGKKPGKTPVESVSRDEERKKLTTLRLKLAERLVSVKNETAMLTTFNEVNMRQVLALKEKYNDDFKERHGTGIGFMSFFTRAVTIALQEFPQVNSMIDGDELVTPHYIDIGIAVSSPKGLVVPVIRNTGSMTLATLETAIREMAVKARENRISIDDMKGGTFTITNGGVFGSLMSTPIINPPQSAILGMHKIMDRPVAVEGRVEIRPMMYIALSYDHRVIDGRESVGFLVRVKELIEDPLKLLTGGEDLNRILLEI
jgi:2-oxoglutarate dehydrogenase E2 component (dihydrolipoamide succinyltransferase)